MRHFLARSMTAMAIAAMATLGLVSPAHAVDGDCYPPDPNVICVVVDASDVASATTLEAGLALSIKLPPPGNPVYLRFSKVTGLLESTPQNLGTFTADGSGHLTATFKIPASTPAGLHHVVMTGKDASGKTLVYSIPITITNAAGSGIPFTGAEVGIASLLGAALVGAGTLAVVTSRRRKAAAQPA